MIQYIIVALIGLICLASIGRRLYIAFYPQANKGGCSGCDGCSLGSAPTKEPAPHKP